MLQVGSVRLELTRLMIFKGIRSELEAGLVFPVISVLFCVSSEIGRSIIVLDKPLQWSVMK